MPRSILQTKPSKPPGAQQVEYGLVTFFIVAGSAILFCSKGVVAKLAYRHGADALTVVTLRMVFSLPFFAAMAVAASRGEAGLTSKDWVNLAVLGFIGYYISSLVNFTGLQYVSVGLERIILYTYPSLVLVLSRFVLGKAVQRAVWVACLGGWIGIVAAFAGEIEHAPSSGRTGLGAFLVFVSALTYAIFIMLSGNMLRRLGAMRFTGIVVGFSGILMIVHHLIFRPVGALMHLPPAVYGLSMVLALFGTVAPAILLSHGLKRAGPEKFAVISAVGPVTTLFLAWWILGERPNAVQALGFVVTVACGLAVSLLKSRA